MANPNAIQNAAAHAHERLEPQILRAAERDDVGSLDQIITTAKQQGRQIDQLLGIALRRSAERGNIEATRYLLTQGASTHGRFRIPPLIRVVEENHAVVAKLLLEFGANPDEQDKDGKTALMFAAWQNRYHIMELLIHHKADVSVKDKEQRNVLHILAADKICDWGDDVIDLLLQQDFGYNGLDDVDILGRTPLHWACVTGKVGLVKRLLECPRTRANIEAVDVRQKTALHFATTNEHEDVVSLLLEFDARVDCTSDGGWTPLHNAAEKGSYRIVNYLLHAGAMVNSRLLSGVTPLHLAAQGGHAEVMEILLREHQIEQDSRDTFGNSPLHRAAQNKHKECLRLLAPRNHVERLSENALGACNGFHATIVAFGNFRNENRVQRRSVYELLYGHDTFNPRKWKPTWPKSNSIDFQWIHLPSNNLAWIQTLFTNSFIEDGGTDVEFLKALEQTFTHQHRGQKVHSHFMRPLCELIPRSNKSGPKSKILHDALPSEVFIEINPRRKIEKGIPAKDSNRAFKDRKTNHNNLNKGVTSSSKQPPGIVVFMPYLHYETDQRRREMQRAISNSENESIHTRSPASNYDEMLIKGHLCSTPVSMHVRRTLDQCFFHNSDTRNRDQDQVIYRYQNKTHQGEKIDPKIFMVDQLYMWILDDERVVTAFPQRWRQPKDDPLNLLNCIIDEINSRTRDPVKTVYDLAMVITEKCSSILDDARNYNEEYQFFKMFESSIGVANDREATLFIEFNKASMQASKWLEQNRRANGSDDYDELKSEDSRAVDKLLYIGEETSLLTETKDIRDELAMISGILNDQTRVIPSLQEAICDIYKDRQRSTTEIRRRLGNETRRIETRMRDLERMDKQTERVYSSILDMLDLKQKHAANTNVFEARFAREQAQGNARQNQILMAFTIVTIIFLPLSFIAAFFTINIKEFKTVDGTSSMSLGYVAKWVFGVGFAIAIPMVILALNLGRMVRFIARMRTLMSGKRKYKVKDWEEEEGLLSPPSSKFRSSI